MPKIKRKRGFLERRRDDTARQHGLLATRGLDMLEAGVAIPPPQAVKAVELVAVDSRRRGAFDILLPTEVMERAERLATARGVTVDEIVRAAMELARG